jgi:aerobic-type carbon monoxide dehydrogenase small subunit (CoxS/CutS family)
LEAAEKQILFFEAAPTPKHLSPPARTCFNSSNAGWSTVFCNHPAGQFDLTVLRPDDGRDPMPRVTELHVNGKSVRIEADGERSLLSVLRDDLDLTGCKYGCGEGECGACTVLIDGTPARSCRTRVGGLGQKKILTIESLEQDGRLHPLQEAFLKTGAMQCGYCTPGMILSGVALLQKKSNPSDQEIVRAMTGNICRCGTYQRIVAAIQEAAKTIRAERK